MDWTSIVTEVFKWLALLAVSALGTAASAWISKRKEREVNAATNESRQALLNEAERAVDTAVDYVKQTITSGIKGTEKWTDAAQAEAKAEAVKTVEAIMGESGMELLSSALDNVEGWLNAKIEAKVLSSKTWDNILVGEPAEGEAEETREAPEPETEIPAV